MKMYLFALALILFSAAVAAIGTRTYDAPVLTPDITNSQVMRFGVVVVLGGDGQPGVDTHFVYVIDVRAADDTVIESHKVKIRWGLLPAGVKADLRGLHDMILTNAENQGLIPSGTDEPY